MPAPITHNDEKAAVRTSHDGLDFVLWTTTASSHGKDNDNVYIRRQPA